MFAYFNQYRNPCNSMQTNASPFWPRCGGEQQLFIHGWNDRVCNYWETTLCEYIVMRMHYVQSWITLSAWKPNSRIVQLSLAHLMIFGRRVVLDLGLPPPTIAMFLFRLFCSCLSSSFSSLLSVLLPGSWAEQSWLDGV